MTTSVYISCCDIKEGTGDGVVSYNELSALQEVSEVELVLGQSKLKPEMYYQPPSVFLQDYFANLAIKKSGKRFDLCHIYGNPYYMTVDNLQQKGTKVVATIVAHNRVLSIEEHERFYGAGTYPFWHVKDDFGFKLYTEHARLADVVITPSTYSKQNLVQDMGVAEDRVRIVPHGVDIPGDTKLMPYPEHFTVAFLSQAGTDKGIPYLIEAWDELGYPDALLILAGVGTEYLEKRIREIATRGHFNLRGRVPDVAEVYNECSVFCLPSSNEAWGIPLIEAMSYGRPVVTTFGCGASDAVDSGEDGLVVEPRNPKMLAERIDWLKNNPDELKRMGANAREKAKQFSWDKIRAKYVNVHKEVMGEK